MDSRCRGRRRMKLDNYNKDSNFLKLNILLRNDNINAHVLKGDADVTKVSLTPRHYCQRHLSVVANFNVKN